MARLFHRRVAFLVSIVVAVSLILPIQAVAVGNITSGGACVVDYDTGVVLFGHEADTPRVPASMVKLVAVNVVYDAIKAGEIGIDTATVISRGVSELSYSLEFSNVPLPVGLSVTIGELLDVAIIWSACAATVALGEALVGSEEAFVERMNEKVVNLGFGAYFFDCYGASRDNNITPREMALFTRQLISDHPEVLVTASKRSVTFRGTEYSNTNQLLGEYIGIDGLKTGFTSAAGYCFVGTAQREGRRIIAVTMGSTQAARFPDARSLLDYGFSVADSVINSQPQRQRRTATPSKANLILNGDEMPLNAFLIGGSHYFRLRDIALLLNGTSKQFNVTFDSSESVIGIVTDTSYSGSGSIVVDIGEDPRSCVLTPSTILVDGMEFSLEVYLIGNSNYFRLRDLGSIVGFRVGWTQSTRTVIIDT